MNIKITKSYAQVGLRHLLLPASILLGIVILLSVKGMLNIDGYVSIQKELFFKLNAQLSQFPSLEYNLTQLGDAFIALSLMSVFISYAPKIWEALLPASLISLIFSKGLKEFFDIPRPVTIFGEEQVHIIGKTLVGYSSLPSGHSITIFTSLTMLLYAFIFNRNNTPIVKALSGLGLVAFGFFAALSRVGVGAHHPLDVLAGCCLGYSAALLGIWISSRYRLFSWIGHPKARPFFIALFVGSLVFVGVKIAQENLIIYYFSLVSLVISLYLIFKSYATKSH